MSTRWLTSREYLLWREANQLVFAHARTVKHRRSSHRYRVLLRLAARSARRYRALVTLDLTTLEKEKTP